MIMKLCHRTLNNFDTDYHGLQYFYLSKCFLGNICAAAACTGVMLLSYFYIMSRIVNQCYVDSNIDFALKIILFLNL